MYLRGIVWCGLVVGKWKVQEMHGEDIIGHVTCGKTKISLHTVVRLCTEGNHISGTIWARGWYGLVHGAPITLFAIA